jgi:phenylalanyl-tRNA synthetase beta chain
MAIITINKKIFEKEIGRLDDKMKERIDMFGTPIESLDDNELQLEIFANRPDMLSYQGFKRSFLGFIGKKTGLEKYKVNKPDKDFIVNIDPSVKLVRPFTVCGIIKNLKLDDEKIREIIEIQEKLHATIGRKRKKVAIGIYPLDKIKFPLTYKAISPEEIKFIPLGENKEMTGLEIIRDHPKGKEYGDLLLNTRLFPIFIDSKENILSMPPIINSEITGKVDNKTKDLFIECSGQEFDILNKCLNIIITSLSDMGGEIYQLELVYKAGIKPNTKKLTPALDSEKIKISKERVNQILGLNLEEKQIKILIEKMRHNYSNEEVEYASYRNDILHEIDIIEDIAIAHGYENFLDEIPSISTIGKENKDEIIKRKISEILTGLKFLEISNYHLTLLVDQTKKMNKDGEGIIKIKIDKLELEV